MARTSLVDLEKTLNLEEMEMSLGGGYEEEQERRLLFADTMTTAGNPTANDVVLNGIHDMPSAASANDKVLTEGSPAKRDQFDIFKNAAGNL